MTTEYTEFATPTVRAGVKHLRVSPYKVRQVLALIRGLSADDAARTLQLCEKDAAGDILKVLDSAIANAEHNRQLPVDELYVARAYADEGPTRKWGQPRARGRYFRVRHRSSHVTIVLARYDEDELEARRRREEAQAATSGRGGRGAQRRRAERVRRSRAAQRAEEHDHDHDHDHEHDHDHDHDQAPGAAAAPEAPEAAAQPDDDTTESSSSASSDSPDERRDSEESE
jgi:large subunit ribosomal protein L22